MLRDRGYLVVDFEINMTKLDFLDKFEDLLINKSRKNDPTDQIYVFFPNDEKVGLKHIKKYRECAKSNISSSAKSDSICKIISSRAITKVSPGGFSGG
ncbi:hypothetical protein OPV22_028951 [Ensete ventricosum]|nr:hypothetical protein OPV22_028951 [Ensete ventricosum]